MLGAIVGDIVGSVYENQPIKHTNFPLFGEGSTFTDDTVLSIAIADSILTGKSYAAALKQWGRKYPQAGYGANFYQWLMSRCSVAYNSWGNGAAMRVSPIGWAFDSLERTLSEAKKCAEVTHNHPEGIKGAEAVAGAIFLCRMNQSKKEIKSWVEEYTGYNLNRTTTYIRPDYKFEVSSQLSIPEAIICFLEGDGVENAIRLAVSLGGDADTQACISGALAHAWYKGIPEALWKQAEQRVPEEMIAVINKFKERLV